MPTSLELKERQKNHLAALLQLKKANEGIVIKELDKIILNAIVGMEEEDVAIVEKLIGVKAI